jgi:hypothetical protein
MMQSTSIPSSKPSAQQTGFKSEKHSSPATPRLDEPAARYAAHQPRIEPWLGAVHSDRKPTYDELRALVAQYDVPTPRKRPFARAGIVATIFVVGSALGFGVASLLGEDPGQAMRISSRHVIDARPGGASAGELPYDGRINAVSKPQQSQSGPSKDELPYGGEKPEAVAIGKMEGATALPQSQLEPAVPISDKAGASPSRESRSESRPRPEILRPEKKNTPVHQRSHVVRRTNKDREIERIKQQAAEELKKKAESRRSAVGAHHASKENADAEQRKTPAAHSTRVPAMTALLEQCEQAGNFIRREQCKWRLCGGKWGKNGCPSYPPRSSLY